MIVVAKKTLTRLLDELLGTTSKRNLFYLLIILLFKQFCEMANSLSVNAKAHHTFVSNST